MDQVIPRSLIFNCSSFWHEHLCPVWSVGRGWAHIGRVQQNIELPCEGQQTIFHPRPQQYFSPQNEIFKHEISTLGDFNVGVATRLFHTTCYVKSKLFNELWYLVCELQAKSLSLSIFSECSILKLEETEYAEWRWTCKEKSIWETDNKTPIYKRIGQPINKRLLTLWSSFNMDDEFQWLGWSGNAGTGWDMSCLKVGKTSTWTICIY